jgi:hypothetical protein
MHVAFVIMFFNGAPRAQSAEPIVPASAAAAVDAKGGRKRRKKKKEVTQVPGVGTYNFLRPMRFFGEYVGDILGLTMLRNAQKRD